MMFKIDDWYEILVFGLMCVAVVLSFGWTLTRFVRKGGRAKITKDGITVDEEKRQESTCILAHTDTLARLEKDMKELQKERETLGQDLRSVYFMIQPMIPAMKVMLLALKGEKINGNVTAALEGLDRAEGFFTDATVGRIGG